MISPGLTTVLDFGFGSVFVFRKVKKTPTEMKEFSTSSISFKHEHSWGPHTHYANIQNNRHTYDPAGLCCVLSNCMCGTGRDSMSMSDFTAFILCTDSQHLLNAPLHVFSLPMMLTELSSPWHTLTNLFPSLLT